MAVEHHEGGTTITGGDIERLRLVALRGRLRLEVAGLRFNGRPSAVIIREATGLTTRNKAKLLLEFDQWLDDNGIRKAGA
jgi:hypothetical protein